MNYSVTPEEDGWRVREILRRSLRVSYTAMKSAKWNGRILLNGDPVFVDVRVKPGDTVTVDWAEEKPLYEIRPYRLELDIPYIDDDLMIVDKPAPLASQSSRGHPDDSLENAVYAYFGCPENYVYRPVNRLDRGTSGLMVIARNPHSQDLLQRQLHRNDFRRRYLALTEGVPDPPEGVLDFPIAKVPSASVKREVNPLGKPCLTRYRVCGQDPSRNSARALVELELETGRTHQIRVHLSHIGCPVVGDFLYGTEDQAFPGRFALHSAYLDLIHPISGELISLASIPDWADIRMP